MKNLVFQKYSTHIDVEKSVCKLVSQDEKH